MADYMGIVKGQRGETSRLGSKRSGLHAYANAWRVGAHSSLHYSSERDCDVVTVWLTDGSGYDGLEKSLGSYIRTDDGFERIA